MNFQVSHQSDLHWGEFNPSPRDVTFSREAYYPVRIWDPVCLILFFKTVAEFLELKVLRFALESAEDMTRLCKQNSSSYWFCTVLWQSIPIHKYWYYRPIFRARKKKWQMNIHDCFSTGKPPFPCIVFVAALSGYKRFKSWISELGLLTLVCPSSQIFLTKQSLIFHFCVKRFLRQVARVKSTFYYLL